MKRQQRKEAMVNNPRVFGDKNTADIRLHLIDYPGNPLYLHSRVLRKAEFFETKLSQRWSSHKPPFEIKVTCCNYHPENYMKFLQLMYSYDTDKRFTFSNVDEALVILPISSEVVYLDCMESCMRYLCALRWSPEQEAQLRVLLASLQINILPDLAARLGVNQSKPDCGHIENFTMIQRSGFHFPCNYTAITVFVSRNSVTRDSFIMKTAPVLFRRAQNIIEFEVD